MNINHASLVLFQIFTAFYLNTLVRVFHCMLVAWVIFRNFKFLLCLFSFIAKFSARYCNPGIEAMVSFDGTSSIALGRGLLMYAAGRVIGLEPSMDDAISPYSSLHSSGKEVHWIVIVDRFLDFKSCF